MGKPNEMFVNYSYNDPECGRYHLHGHCNNCGIDINGEFSQGQKANPIFGGRDCPNCGCNEAHFSGESNA